MNGLEEYKKDLASKARIIEILMEDIPDLKGRQRAETQRT
jgi:hypothetical protein